MTHFSLSTILCTFFLLVVSSSKRHPLTLQIIPFAQLKSVTFRLKYSYFQLNDIGSQTSSFYCAIYPWTKARIKTSLIWNQTWKMNFSTCDSSSACYIEEEVNITATPQSVPKPWELFSPMLYTIKCELSVISVSLPSNTFATSRFGFRSFEAKNGSFWLNKAPIFLRGHSVNPPGRGLPDVSKTKQFALDYLMYFKNFAHINAVRIGDGTDPGNVHWYEAADEIGMLIYAGPYSNPKCHGCSAKPASKPPPSGSTEEAFLNYKAVLDRTASHPSHVILILTNEIDIATSQGHWGPSPYYHEYAELMKNITELLLAYDSNRAYLGDAGFGQGMGGQILDDHTYYGWYQGDWTSYYLNHPISFDQPMTFTECVGSYLTQDGDLDVGGKNYGWSLKWTGHSSQGKKIGAQHAMTVAKGSIEIIRRNRAIHPQLSGIMPFLSPFYYCGDNVTSFNDIMKQGVSPVLIQEKISFSPILLSLELWSMHIYIGEDLRFKVHVVNDDNFRHILSPTNTQFLFQSKDKTRTVIKVNTTISFQSLAYYSTTSKNISISTSTLYPGAWWLNATLRYTNGSIVTYNFETIVVFPIPSCSNPDTRVPFLYDPMNKTALAFDKLNISYSQIFNIKHLPNASVLILGENIWGKDVEKQIDHLIASVHSGGRILILQQSQAPMTFKTGWLPDINNRSLMVSLPSTMIAHSGLSVNSGMPVHVQRSTHPLFNKPYSVDLNHMRRWNDWTSWQPGQSGVPELSPASFGLKINTSSGDAELWAAIDDIQRHSSIIAARGMGLQDATVMEIFDRGVGQGSVLIFGLEIVNRVKSDPVADKLLRNVAHYITSQSSFPPHSVFEVGHTIVWGNYTTERGIIVSNPSGLIIKRCPFDKKCHEGSQGTVPCGRITFGPYTWTFMAHDVDLAPNNTTGTGIIWMRTSADSIKSTFFSSSTNTNDISGEVEILDTHMRIVKKFFCNTLQDKMKINSVIVMCDIASNAIKHSINGFIHIGLRFTANKKDILVKTIFLSKKNKK